MQKGTLIILVIVGHVLLAAAQQDPGVAVAGWAGSTAGLPTFHPPELTGSSCAPNTGVTASYVALNQSFATAGVRQVALLAENAFKGTVSVYLYNTSFNSASSCTNYERQLVNSNFGGSILIVDDEVWFAASTQYYFVVSSATGTAGKFSLVIPSTYASGSSVGGLTWNPPFLNGSCQVDTTTNQTFSTAVFQVGTSAYYDLNGLFDLGASPSTHLVLYSGNYTATTIAAGVCTYPLNSTIMVTAKEGDRSATALYEFLTANQPYTAVISTTYTGNWGIQVLPTRVALVTDSGFTQPSRSLPCTASSFTNAPWVAVSLPATPGPFYIVDTDTIPSYYSTIVTFDTYTFGYDGSNVNTTSAPPSACPAPIVANLSAFADTGNTTGPLLLTQVSSTNTYTIIVSDASGSALSGTGYAAQIYAFTGVPFANASAPTTTTTSTSSTGASSSTGLTSGGSGSTSHNATSTSTTSAASAASFSALALLVAGAVALLL